jgi:hypothetical protein
MLPKGVLTPSSMQVALRTRANRSSGNHRGAVAEFHLTSLAVSRKVTARSMLTSQWMGARSVDRRS